MIWSEAITAEIHIGCMLTAAGDTRLLNIRAGKCSTRRTIENTQSKTTGRKMNSLQHISSIPIYTLSTISTFVTYMQQIPDTESQIQVDSVSSARIVTEN